MRPTKYPEFHYFVDVEEPNYRCGIYIREMFDSGIAIVHADYMVEMSFRHPVMYFLFYRWWILMFLHENQRKYIGKYIKRIRSKRLPYWAEFSLYHPIQYCLFWIVISLFEFVVKLFTAPIKIIKRAKKVEE